jgi:uncharacterized protein (TIGR03382 family)
VLRIAKKVPVAPVPLNARPLDSLLSLPVAQRQVELVGYGITRTGNTDSGVQRDGTATLTDLQDGGTDFGQLAMLTPNPGGVCSGDSGGKADMTFDGVKYQIGIISFVARPSGTGTGPVLCQDPTAVDGIVRADTSLQFFSSFIATQNGGNANSVSGVAPQPASGGCSTSGDSYGALGALGGLALAMLSLRRKQRRVAG